MVKKRLITVLTFNDGVLFRTKDFKPDYRYTLNFVDAWSIDEVAVLDVTRPGMGSRENFYSVVSDFAGRCFVPLSAGGWVKTIDDFTTLLRLGADKVIINTAALETPDLITKAAKLFGSQCVVVSIDAKRRADGSYEVYSAQGTQPTGQSPEKWAKDVELLGAGEILVTAIHRDGSLEGYDNELVSRVASAVNVPVLACGGAGKWQDFVDGFTIGKASAVCTACIYHFTETSIKSVKSYLKKAGIDVR